MHIKLSNFVVKGMIHSVDHTMRQTPVARNYRLAAVPRMTCLAVQCSKKETFRPETGPKHFPYV